MVALAREPLPAYLAVSSAEAGAAALRTFWRLAEAWKLKPTVSDLKTLAAADSFKQMMQNRLFKVILVAALSNVGAMLGMFVGVYLIWHWLGLNLSAEMI